jgi:hypothetical protein
MVLPIIDGLRIIPAGIHQGYPARRLTLKNCGKIFDKPEAIRVQQA